MLDLIGLVLGVPWLVLTGAFSAIVAVFGYLLTHGDGLASGAVLWLGTAWAVRHAPDGRWPR